MIAEIRVTPVCAATPFNALVAKLVPILAESQLQYQVHALGTIVEGDLDAILDLARRVHQELRKHAERVLLELSIDDREGLPGELLRSVEHLRDLSVSPLERLALPPGGVGPTIGVAERIHKLLTERGIAYGTLHHARDFTAQETAHHTHTPGRAFAKAVIVRLGDGYAMAVAPAHHEIDLERLGEALGHRSVELASEAETARLCGDCEVGAVPPFGNLYGLPVYASPVLAESAQITCVAGGHADAIRLAWADYERVVQPTLLPLSAPRAPATSPA